MNERRAPRSAERQADAVRIAELVESAFHYRGDVTVYMREGGAVTGYLYNRDTRAGERFAQMFETQTGREVSLSYRNITAVHFTGRDAAAAADERFEAIQGRRQERAEAAPSPPHVQVAGDGS